MSPTETLIQWQTDEIIRCLLQDESEYQDRSLDAYLESDGPEDDTFDPVLLADKLRSVADAINDDANFMAAMTDLKKAVAEEAAVAAFSSGVEAVCKSQVSQRAEVAPEWQLIRASVALGLYVKKTSPELRNKVQYAMSAFLNKRVGSWVTNQGGWDKLNILS